MRSRRSPACLGRAQGPGGRGRHAGELAPRRPPRVLLHVSRSARLQAEGRRKPSDAGEGATAVPAGPEVEVQPPFSPSQPAVSTLPANCSYSFPVSSHPFVTLGHALGVYPVPSSVLGPGAVMVTTSLQDPFSS